MAALKKAKQRIERSFKGIQAALKYTPYPFVVQLIDQANGHIKSSVELMNEAIGVFKSQAK